MATEERREAKDRLSMWLSVGCREREHSERGSVVGEQSPRERGLRIDGRLLYVRGQEGAPETKGRRKEEKRWTGEDGEQKG
jgi:hypothetical protein